MFRNGQFGGRKVYMDELLSQPVDIDMPDPVVQNAQMPDIQVSGASEAPNYDGLGEGIGSLVGAGLGYLLRPEEQATGPDGKTPATEVFDVPEGGVNTQAYDKMMFAGSGGNPMIGASNFTPPKSNVGGGSGSLASILPAALGSG